MKSNFDFLNRYWPALAQIGATAETYVYSDPNACIYKLGMFAERLVQEILVFEHIAEPAVDNTHANRIRILKRAGLLPHEIDNTLYVLRKTRNSAVHIGTDSVDEAKTLLSLTYNLAVWFMETYGDWGYIAPEFVMPSETTHEDLESVIAEQERKIEELTKQLAVVKTAASGKTQKERARRSESVSAMMNWNEAQTRCLIDEQLRLSGWEADTQNLRYSKGTRPVKGRNIAISEWPTNSAFYKNGYADYAFFVGEKLVALMDAKKMSEDVASTIDVQVKDYAAHIKPEDIPHTVGNWNGYQVPFLFASNGRAYLEQLRTKSGIWFLDVREQENQLIFLKEFFILTLICSYVIHKCWDMSSICKFFFPLIKPISNQGAQKGRNRKQAIQYINELIMTSVKNKAWQQIILIPDKAKSRQSNADHGCNDKSTNHMLRTISHTKISAESLPSLLKFSPFRVECG